MVEQYAHPALHRLLADDRCSEAVELLGHDLAGSDATTLLLAVLSDRAAALTSANVLSRYQRDRFVIPSPLDPIALAQLRLEALQSLRHQFEPIELAPLTPLGSHSVFSRVDQNNVVSTVRMSEVAADPTNQLALEAAVRRRAQLAEDPRSDATVRLCGVQRVTRAQVFSGQRSFAHFTVLGAIVAGRSRPNRGFESAGLVEVVTSMAAFVSQATSRPTMVSLTSIGDRASDLVHGVATQLSDDGITCVVDPTRSSGRGYYRDACFKISVDCGDEIVELGDGGATDWTSTLLQNNKERLVIGGVGIDRLLTVIGS